jgi:pSer/pThr/pTyr-binding forkhead associated (FHA) protein
MKIELLLDLSRKGIFSFPNNKTVIVGRQENADIVLEGKDISRDHIHIFYKEGKVFIEDKGSTCGVFIDEERIAPFEEIEFTSYFQARVGEHYFMSLLSHEDEDDVTSISTFNREMLKSPKATLTEHTKTYQNYKALAAQQKTGTKKLGTKKIVKKNVKKVEKKSNTSLFLLIILVMAAAVYYFKFRD